MTYKKINQSESKLEYDIEEARKILAQQNRSFSGKLSRDVNRYDLQISE